MFSKKSMDYLLSTLNENGYQGDRKSLIKALKLTEEITKLDKFDIIMKGYRNKYTTKENLNNLKYISRLVHKCVLKYEDKYLETECRDLSFNFYGKRRSSKYNKYCISFYFFDNSDSSFNGIIGECGVRVLYGYEDHRKEKFFIFKDKREYNEEEYYTDY